MQMHVVEQLNAANNVLVDVSDSSSPRALNASSIRVVTRVISLTTNNLSYIKSNMMGWWYAYPLPDVIASSYPREKFMHAPGWGFAEVLESNIGAITKGSWVFGYIPFSTMPVDLKLAPARVQRHFQEVSEHRRELVTFYNRMEVVPIEQVRASKKEDMSWRALMRALFGTGFDLANFALAWKPEERVHPAGLNTGYEWDYDRNADVKDAVVLVLAAAGKAALTFAHQLKYGRPDDAKPRQVIAFTSQHSSHVAAESGFYDVVHDYDKLNHLQSMLEPDAKVLIVDCTSRPVCDSDWLSSLQSHVNSPITEIYIAALPPAASHGVLALAPKITSQAIEKIGEVEYYRRIEDAFGEFSKHRRNVGVNLVVKKSLDDFKTDFDDIVAGKFDTSKGLVYWL